jgi:hypothetical protein
MRSLLDELTEAYSRLGEGIDPIPSISSTARASTWVTT